MEAEEKEVAVVVMVVVVVVVVVSVVMLEERVLVIAALKRSTSMHKQLCAQVEGTCDERRAGQEHASELAAADRTCLVRCGVPTLDLEAVYRVLR